MMLKLLIKKQLAEIFRSYFYDAKKNTRRSKLATMLYFLLYLLLMVGFLGGMFTFLAIMLCKPLSEAGMGWLYYLLTGMIAIFLGVFGSVFSTYSGLYLAKDNDLLLSLPIPVNTIILSRLSSVYLMGLLYSAVVSIPSAIVYLIYNFSVKAIVGGLMNVLLISVFVAILSCLLGWVVAKISQKLKNKSFLTVLISLAFLGGYYFIYFKAQSWIQELIANAVLYGEQIKGRFYALYLLGRAGQGEIVPMLFAIAATAILGALIMLLMSKSFIKLATSTGSSQVRRKALRSVGQLSVRQTLLKNELTHFTSSANYMLNCGLGTILLPAAGIAMLIKGRELAGMFETFFGESVGCTQILLIAAVCLVASMNDMAAPSVSLEGKSLWIKQSLPVTGWQVLVAKLRVQLLLTVIPTLFCALCLMPCFGGDLVQKLLSLIVMILYVVFMSCFDLFLGIKSPSLHWTNEIMPIKQSMPVFVALFGGWGVAILIGGLYFAFGWRLGLTAYLAIVAVITAALSALLLGWLKNAGANAFEKL